MVDNRSEVISLKSSGGMSFGLRQTPLYSLGFVSVSLKVLPFMDVVYNHSVF